MDGPDAPDLISLAEAGRRGPWSARTLRRMVGRREIRHWRLAGRIYFSREDLAGLVLAGEVPARSDSDLLRSARRPKSTGAGT
jgi:hypothetical protein